MAVWHLTSIRRSRARSARRPWRERVDERPVRTGVGASSGGGEHVGDVLAAEELVEARHLDVEAASGVGRHLLHEDELHPFVGVLHPAPDDPPVDPHRRSPVAGAVEQERRVRRVEVELAPRANPSCVGSSVGSSATHGSTSAGVSRSAVSSGSTHPVEPLSRSTSIAAPTRRPAPPAPRPSSSRATTRDRPRSTGPNVHSNRRTIAAYPTAESIGTIGSPSQLAIDVHSGLEIRQCPSLWPRTICAGRATGSRAAVSSSAPRSTTSSRAPR